MVLTTGLMRRVTEMDLGAKVDKPVSLQTEAAASVLKGGAPPVQGLVDLPDPLPPRITSVKLRDVVNTN